MLSYIKWHSTQIQYMHIQQNYALCLWYTPEFSICSVDYLYWLHKYVIISQWKPGWFYSHCAGYVFGKHPNGIWTPNTAPMPEYNLRTWCLLRSNSCMFIVRDIAHSIPRFSDFQCVMCTFSNVPHPSTVKYFLIIMTVLVEWFSKSHLGSASLILNALSRPTMIVGGGDGTLAWALSEYVAFCQHLDSEAPSSTKSDRSGIAPSAAIVMPTVAMM